MSFAANHLQEAKQIIDQLDVAAIDRVFREGVTWERNQVRCLDDVLLAVGGADYVALAERLVGPDPGALAEELGVSKWVIEVWQREARVGREWTCVQREAV